MTNGVKVAPAVLGGLAMRGDCEKKKKDARRDGCTNESENERGTVCRAETQMRFRHFG